MLESYGQSPIIVRSSSILEDGFGNAFTGKYESVFLPNQGSPGERLDALLDAIRVIYASSLGEEALRYRERRGLLHSEEQMAVLVQRVSGAVQGRFFYPQLAGVALSYNPYVWNAGIDPQAGVVRLVFGLGTRAVERSDDDYTRVVALNAPALRPEMGLEEASQYAQRRVDVIDLADRRFRSVRFEDVVAESSDLPTQHFASPRGRGWVLGFDQLLWQTPFVEQVREMLATLRDAYGTHVDVEFTGNFLPDGTLRLNLVQCRPLQVREGGAIEAAPSDVSPGAVLLASSGPIVGRSRLVRIDRVLYVDGGRYAALGTQDRHEVARVVGRASRLEPAGGKRVMLVGPGRWGTTTPSLGVPVSFPEIQRVRAVCEVMRLGNLIPDVSLGSHFFNDLVEEDMLYLAFFFDYPGHAIDLERLRGAPDRLVELLPDDARMAGVVRVIDFPHARENRALWLHADCVRQEARCYLR
jgi:pyruvate,water dikinase